MIDKALEKRTEALIVKVNRGDRELPQSPDENDIEQEIVGLAKGYIETSKERTMLLIRGALDFFTNVEISTAIVKDILESFKTRVKNDITTKLRAAESSVIELIDIKRRIAARQTVLEITRDVRYLETSAVIKSTVLVALAEGLGNIAAVFMSQQTEGGIVGSVVLSFLIVISNVVLGVGGGVIFGQHFRDSIGWKTAFGFITLIAVILNAAFGIHRSGGEWSSLSLENASNIVVWAYIIIGVAIYSFVTYKWAAWRDPDADLDRLARKRDKLSREISENGKETLHYIQHAASQHIDQIRLYLQEEGNDIAECQSAMLDISHACANEESEQRAVIIDAESTADRLRTTLINAGFKNVPAYLKEKPNFSRLQSPSIDLASLNNRLTTVYMPAYENLRSASDNACETIRATAEDLSDKANQLLSQIMQAQQDSTTKYFQPGQTPTSGVTS